MCIRDRHLYVLGAEVIYSDVQDQLHASGHGSQGDMLLLMSLVKAKYLIPIGGTIRHQRHYLQLARKMNYDDKDVFLLNEGETVVFENGKADVGRKVITKSVFVDAYGIGDVGDVILRDRQTLSTEGVVICIIKMSMEKKLVEDPIISARGFVYGVKNERERLFSGAQKTISDCIDKHASGPNLKREIIASLEKYLLKETRKEPMVIVELLQV